jgi:transposase
MNYIGIDVQKRISAAVVIDDNEKILVQYVDFETNNEMLDEILKKYPVWDTTVLIENLTVAHRVYHHLTKMGYNVLVIHTGNGCVTEIARSKYKCDLADAQKLAVICKDIVTGRREYRMTHISSEEEMKAKGLCRALNDFSEQVTRINLQIQEYMNLWDLSLPDGYKSFTSKKALKHMINMSDHPTLGVYAKHMMYLQDEIETMKVQLEKLYEGNDGITILKSIKGIGIQTAATIYSAIDGIERFDSPEKLTSHFGLDLTRKSSGGVEGQRHISKQGDPMVRKLLANVVNNIPKFYPESDIGDFYKRMKDRKAYWDAVTATMRKTVHTIWAMLTRMEPFRCRGSRA